MTDNGKGTLRRAIEFETLANQPTGAFLHRGSEHARGILRSNQALYLSYRITAEKGCYPFLPRFMKKICDGACSGLPQHTHEARNKTTRMLCEWLVKHEPELVKLLLEIKKPARSKQVTSVASWFSKKLPSIKISTAAAFGNLPALQSALNGKADEVWAENDLFGPALVLAAAGGHIDVVRSIIKHFEVCYAPKGFAYEVERQFCDAIDMAFRNDHLKIALLLLHIHHEYGCPVEVAEAGSWLGHAIRLRNRDAVVQVQKLKRSHDSDAGSEFGKACASGDLAAVRIFVEESLVSLRTAVLDENTAIGIAIEAGNQDVVRILLEMGASPSGESYHWLVSPLDIAITKGNAAIVQLLLQYGANPESQIHRWESETQGFRDDQTAIRVMLIEAAKRKEYYVPSTTPRTNFAGEAVDLTLAA